MCLNNKRLARQGGSPPAEAGQLWRETPADPGDRETVKREKIFPFLPNY